MSQTASERSWFGHPAGLSTLFFTEMWERFSYYGMRALLILYMTALPAVGGIAFSTEQAAKIYGLYTFAVYAVCIPGGLIADRWLGHYRAIYLGGIVIALGHFSLAVGTLPMFYLGLGLIIVGTGFLKPNISTMVGQLYAPGDARRDGGYSIYYMGINLGAMIAPLVCGFLAQSESFKARLEGWGLDPASSWHWGFGAAGVGMVLGLVQLHLGSRRLMASVHPESVHRRAVALPAGGVTAAPKDAGLSTEEWKRLAVIGVLFAFATLFWSGFEQAGSSLNLFADRLTELHLFDPGNAPAWVNDSAVAAPFYGPLVRWLWGFPSSWFQSLNPLYVLILAPIFSWLWVALGSREPSSPLKFVFGLMLLGLGFLLLVPAAGMAQAGEGIRVSPMWLVGGFFLHTAGEMCLSPVALSMVTKLAPLRLVGTLMGAWFLTNACGNWVGGWIASFFDRLPLSQIFFAVFGTTFGAGVLLLFLVPMLKRLMGGVK
ncbi:MAG TPA: MFS transporter [Verrucomicrobiales bacterium]|nr:MFS transporter [Verrucomicrobiales bacterium]